MRTNAKKRAAPGPAGKSLFGCGIATYLKFWQIPSLSKSTGWSVSEIVGAGAAAGIGNAYYPAQTNPWVKTYQRWGTQLALDEVFNVLKKFWPAIDRPYFHGTY